MTQSSGSNAAAAATALLVDRFVSASSADDARESLQGIVTALQATPTAEEDQLDPSIIWQEEETLEAFLQVLTTGEYKGIPVDQGPPLVCQIYAEFIKAKDSSIVLQKPQPGRLVQSLLDVICNTEEYAYSRVSALQVLQKICSKYPSVAQTHLLEVPNGLHRLADMFKEDNEQVRNEVLLLAKVIAQWPSCAKIWVFAEVCDSVIELAVQEGGLTNGNVLVMDCLDLLHSLLKHDASLSDLVWQSPIFANKLATLLDLRRGTEFLNPKKPLPTDDLDDILQSGNEGTAKPLIPALTREEEALLTKVLDLAGVMLSSETIRHTVWKRHLALGSLVWELSLLSPPPPGVPHVCAVPSANLQQQALNCVAESFSSLQTMQRHNGLDRLLYLVCTGGASTDFKEKLGLSQSALHVIRRTLSDEVAKETVMHTLAPPTSSDETSEPEPSVILKLLNTVMENVSAGDGIDLDRRKINLLGSLGGLCVFMRDATTREMMLRITSPHALIDVILKSLETQEEFIALSFLRFLSEWMVKTPPVVEAVLSSTQSTSLSVLFGSNGEKGVLAGLLLGVAMEYMDDKESEKYGGWTRASILTMISKRSGGISGFMSELEDMKTSDLPWKACPLEQKTFFKWYNDQVLVVRSRIVQELAQGSDAEDDENQGTGSRALQKIVAQQSKELQELQAAAAVAKSEIESRDSQLSIWKRRMESNPTQLDDMLSEFSDKNVELETDVSKLRKELESLRESHDEQLLKKEEEIRGLTTQIDESRLREEEARSDSDRLRGELAALSSAYSNLEEDYNVSQLSRSAAALHAGVVDSGEDGQQQEGEVSSQGKGVTLSEADTLRAENTRLRNDARAADEWMQLAHQRMGEIGSQNLVLQQELDSMKAMLPETTSQQTDNREVGEFLQEANDRCSELEKEILALKANHGSEGGAMDTPLEQEQRARKELEEKLENAQIDVVSALDSLGQSKSKTEELLREIDDLKSELQLANANITALNEERRQLERKITLQGAEGQVEDEGELLASLQADNQAKQEELDSLRSSVKYLQDEVASARSAVGLSLNTDDESAKSDSAEKVGGQESSQETRGQELEQLRAANKAAQDWMESAVEHHRMLTEQVANLTADKEDLIRQNTARQGGDDNETAKILQQRLDSQDAELRQREGELRIIQAEASLRTSAYEATKEALESEVSRLEAELLSRTDESNSIRNTSEEGLEDLKLEVESIFDSSRGLEKIVDEQKIEIEEMRNQISVLSSERDTQGAEVNDLTVKLKEFEEWAAAAQERLSLLATEKEAVEQKLALSEATSTNSSSGLDELAETNEKLSLDKADLSIRLVTLEEECGVQSARLSELELLLEEKDMEIISLQESCQQATADLAETEKEAFVVTQQWQETAAELEVNINELKEALSNQENEASDVVKQWTQRCEELEQTVEGFESEMQAFSAGDTSELTAKIDELESTISSLEHTLEAQQQEGIEAVGQWSSRCGELDDVVKDLSSQCDSLVADKESLMERLAEADESSEKELELKESMSLQIELFETEATSSKSRLVEFAEESGKTIEGLENEVESLEATIEEKEEVIRKAEEGLEDLRVKMADMQATSIKSAEITTERIRNMEFAVAHAQERIDANESKTKATVLQLESQRQQIEAERGALSKEIESVRLEKEHLVERLKAQEGELMKQLEVEREARLLADHVIGDAEIQLDAVAKQSEEVIEQWQERVAELESANAEFETELEQQQVEAMDAIAQWEGTCGELETKVTYLESAETQASEVLIGTLRVEHKKRLCWIKLIVQDYDEDVAFEVPPGTRTEDIHDLFNSFTMQSDEAMMSGIDQLKKLLHSCEETNKALEQSLDEQEEKLGKSTEEFSKLQSLSADLDDSTGILQEKCATLEEEISEERSRNGVLKIDLKSTKTQLEVNAASISRKEKEISQQGTEMASLRVQFLAIQDELSQATLNTEGAEKTIQSLRNELADATSNLLKFEELLEQTAASKLEAEEGLKAQKELALARESNAIDNERTSVSLREECEVLRAENGLLETELKSLNESLQVHVTDEVSKRATEMATQALRVEMEQMRTHRDGSQGAILDERRARLAAEQEASNLKSDLALVLRVTDEEGNADEKIKSLIMKTSDGVQRKERQEIDGLRKSLGRTAQELESLRGAETEALSRAAAAELQASICEQEVINAKSDVVFLTRSLEETHEAEAARVASFEYRICALEDDRDVVRRYHADEIETLRNELSHVCMEKDRILHSLKESEKANTALVYETSKDQEAEVTEHVENELSKLRRSNARLLSAATEEGVRTERRIREAIAANASLVEADVIVERELRVAAETALENVKSQLEETRRSLVDEPTPSSTQTLSPDRLKTHLSQSREKSRKVEAENNALKLQLQEFESKSEAELANLTDECRRAQASLLKLEGEAKFGSAVNLEATRIHSLPSHKSSENWVVVEKNSDNIGAEASLIGDGPSSSEAYDFIDTLKAEIQEERQMYQELLAEHDDLLALLAQQDLEKSSLNQALANAAGPRAVDAAIQEAEEKAIQQFGKYVRLAA